MGATSKSDQPELSSYMKHFTLSKQPASVAEI